MLGEAVKDRAEGMEPIAPRQSEILKEAREAGQVMVDDLAQTYQVTPQTIRKDINDLCQRGLLQRIHGGAVISTSVTNFAYEARRRLAHEEKRLIGVAAARLIPGPSTAKIRTASVILAT